MCVYSWTDKEKVGRKNKNKNSHFMASNSIFESVSFYQSAVRRGKYIFLYVCIILFFIRHYFKISCDFCSFCTWPGDLCPLMSLVDIAWCVDKRTRGGLRLFCKTNKQTDQQPLQSTAGVCPQMKGCKMQKIIVLYSLSLS